MGTTLSTSMRVGNRPMTSQEADAARAKEEQLQREERNNLFQPDGTLNPFVGAIWNAAND